MERSLTKREDNDLELAIKLRSDGVVNTPGDPFEEADNPEISDLIGRGVFAFVKFDSTVHGGVRIFRSRMMHETKGKETKPCEKWRLVIQGYNDHGKDDILTQSPTIQRASQRLIMAIGPSLVLMGT